MKETIKLHYATLPSRYILVVEGSKANPRQIIARALEIFWKTRYYNLLALAWGIWMVHVTAARSLSRVPLYARFAALHMMACWITNIKIRKSKNWLFKWKISVMKMIFHERNKAALPIQTLYRIWRDRNKFIALHEVSPYNGPLSDIYLASRRPTVLFFIPAKIRNTRRVYWLASVVIQKYFRRMSLWREYKRSRRRILLLQSLCRMYPKMVQYKRLKRMTIKCQAWMRRTVLNKKYVLLRRATITVQKYARRFLSILRMWRMFDKKWRTKEDELSAAIRIQRRWRIYTAYQKVDDYKIVQERRDLAALLLQKNWYRLKNGFHTFLLMSCYRVRDIEENILNQKKWSLKRHHAAKRIQKQYRKHYFKRIISAVVKVQCWFRGRLGYRLVDLLRVEKWAARKLHHWARVRMKYRHRFAHKIAHAWLRWKKGRLLEHLQHKAKIQDLWEDRFYREKRYVAASRIQAVVKGIWTRRWVKRHIAAITIQRPLKRYLQHRRWLRKIREKLLMVVKKVVNDAILRGVVYRTRHLVKLHSKMLIKPQAVIRGYLTKLAYQRAKQHAYRYGLAVVKVQRFWRASGDFVRAVQEILALKRMSKNPFRGCSSLNEILRLMYRQTNKYFNLIDPRAGLKITSFLYRLGLTDLLPMFPKKDYRYVSDLRTLDMTKLLTLYQQWQFRLADKDKNKEKSKDKLKERDKWRLGKTSAAPRTILQDLLKIISPPIPVRQPKDVELMRKLFALPELFQDSTFESFFMSSFIQKFGKGYLSRAENLTKLIIEKEFTNYNNYKSVGIILTPGIIQRSFNAANGASDVKSVLEILWNSLPSPAEERVWDTNRLQQCAIILQLAVERAKHILPPGPISDMLENVSTKVATYRRKFKFTINRIKNGYDKGKNSDNISVGSNSTKSVPMLLKSRSDMKNSSSNLVNNDSSNASKMIHLRSDSEDLGGASVAGVDGSSSLGGENTLTSNNNTSEKMKRIPSKNKLERALTMKSNPSSTPVVNTSLSFDMLDNDTIKSPTKSTSSAAIDSINRIYYGSIDDAEIEMNISICKVYLETLDKLHKACRSFHILKCIWRRRSHARKIQQAKVKEFLTKTKAAYVAERRINHVHIIWNKFRRAEEIARKMKDIEIARAARAARLNEILKWIPKYGWEESIDSFGYSVWLDKSNKNPPQRDTPVYTVRGWDAATKIQFRARKYIAAMAERRRLKHEAMLREVEAARKEWELQLKKAEQHVTAIIKIDKENLISKYTAPNDKAENVDSMIKKLKKGTEVEPDAASDKSTGAADGTEAHNDSCLRNNQQHIPYWLRFETTPLVSESWAVYLFDDELRYENVFVFCIRKQGKSCDLRTTKNEYRRNVSTDRIVQIRLSIGSEVEARYKGRPLFYKGKVTSVYQNANKVYYTILYDDGEKEYKVTREYIRSTNNAITEFLYKRKLVKEEYDQRIRREAYYKSLRATRGTNRSIKVDLKCKEFFMAWSMNNKDSPESIMNGEIPLKTMNRVSNELRKLQFKIDVKINYCRHALVYPWKKHPTLKNSYVNPRTSEVTSIPPRYTLTDHFYAKKIQSVWAVRVAKKKFKAVLWDVSVHSIVVGVIEKYKKIAFIGYGLEGATCQQILRRAGYWDVADCMDDLMKHRPLVLKSLSIDQLVHMGLDKFKLLGITRDYDIKRLKAFQEWWIKTSEKSKNDALSFLNYSIDPYDPRDQKTCSLDAIEVFYNRLLKHFSKNAARVRSMSVALSHSIYPITKMQIDSFCAKYSGRAALAQVRICRLDILF